MNKNKGFTLVELAITLIILAIVGAMAVPSLVNTFKTQHLKTSTHELRTVFTEARGKAVIERRNITVVLGSNAVNTETQLNWMPSGKSILKSGPTSIVFQLNGTIQSGADVEFVICDDAVEPELSQSIGLTRMGVIQSITEGKCE